MSFLIAQKCIYLRDKMSKKPSLWLVLLHSATSSKKPTKVGKVPRFPHHFYSTQ